MNYLDMARGTGIILVILGHISYLSEASRIFIVSFHMPLFFIISGILLSIKKEQDRPLHALALRKLKTIMLPYLLYSVAAILIYIIYYLLTGRDGGWSAVLLHIIETLTLYGFSVMWFLPSIFLSELFFLALIKKTILPAGTVGSGTIGRIKPAIRRCLPIAAVVFPVIAAFFLNRLLESANALYGQDTAFAVFHLFAVSLLRVPFCASFIAAGWGAASLLPKIFKESANPSPKLTVPAELFIGADLLGLALVFSHINGVTDLHFLIFNNLVCYYIAALSGAFSVILFSRALEGLSQTPPLRLLSYYGKNSLIIMVTHLNFYVLYLAEVGAMHFTKTVPEGVLKHNAFILLTLFFTLCGETVLIEVMKRLRSYSSL